LYHWLQVHDSDIHVSTIDAEVTVELRDCRSKENGGTVGGMEVRVLRFRRLAGDWEYLDSSLDLTGFGTCDPSGP
jgi:hypothetical protein